MQDLSESTRVNSAGELVYRCDDCDTWSSEINNGQCAFCWHSHYQEDRNDYPDGFDPDLYDL